jgi:hypothetical protein
MSVFHSVQGVPRVKMERFAGKATKLNRLTSTHVVRLDFNPALQDIASDMLVNLSANDCAAYV